MDVYLLIAIRKEAPDAPEVLCAWDEWSIEENPEGYENDKTQRVAEIGSDLLAHREFRVTLDETAIITAMDTEPVVLGETPVAPMDT